ncbi:MAG: 50S ribosomal protein L4 [Candidatus Niyogibacteria bacterium]|nr:50S ribosomal protein L4 [Candidatus Niyogibacteria bacterium]
MKTDIYNWKAEKTGTIELPESVFGVRWNVDLMHQIVEAMRMNARAPVAHAKGRGEVRGGGKKPWRQKGTGRARHGSIRSPIWKGGGVTHGPTKEKLFGKALPRKMKTKALWMALARKKADNEMLVLDAAIIPEGKTKTAAVALRSLSHIPGFEAIREKNTGIIIGAQDPRTARAFRNIPGVRTVETRNLTALDVLGARFIILGKDAAGAFGAKK